MCGIAGFWNSSSRRNYELEETARCMASVLQHRGPDDEGVWTDTDASLALAHRRLAILDLSREGHQPMHSRDQRYVIVFNGEIYNFNSLRSELEKRGGTFRGHSDTEIALEAISEWGLSASLERFTGMFAFALWDRAERQLHLVRDRAGEKPLYYGWVNGVFVFGSELKALKVHPQWRGKINRGALALMTRYGYIPSPHCIYEGIHKLSPACVLTLTEAAVRTQQTPSVVPYWSAQQLTEEGAIRPFTGSEAEAIDQLNQLLSRSVRHQMVADVPVGAFLSGGIDSSLVVALMQAQSRRAIKTFSIGFQQQGFNEAPFARAVAGYLETDHTELYVSDSDLSHVIPRLPRIYDEPLADPSGIPTTLLCQLAAAEVKVSLSGDGGDELFGGYNHYHKSQRIWRAISFIPGPLRRPVAGCLRTGSQAGLFNGYVVNGMRHFLIRASNLAELLPAASEGELYRLLMSPNRNSHEWLSDPSEPECLLGSASRWDPILEPIQRMTSLDFRSYLPDDILTKVDRAAMSVSLETRIPLLDHHIIEFAFRLPGFMKERDNQGKWLLRQILHRYVPPALVDRPKSGFAAPIGEWLRGPLREWAEHLLGEGRLRQELFFNWPVVRQRWREHLSEHRDWSQGLWHILMFQAWLDEQTAMPSVRSAAPIDVSG
jgi:asparagine synthase (glutamine-hydrolysing)